MGLCEVIRQFSANIQMSLGLSGCVVREAYVTCRSIHVTVWDGHLSRTGMWADRDQAGSSGKDEGNSGPLTEAQRQRSRRGKGGRRWLRGTRRNLQLCRCSIWIDLRTQCTRVNAGLNPLFIHFNSLPVWWSTLIWALRSVPDLLIFDSLLICPPPPLTLFSPLSFIYAVFVWLAPQ